MVLARINSRPLDKPFSAPCYSVAPSRRVASPTHDFPYSPSRMSRYRPCIRRDIASFLAMRTRYRVGRDTSANFYEKDRDSRHPASCDRVRDCHHYTRVVPITITWGTTTRMFLQEAASRVGLPRPITSRKRYKPPSS